MPSTHFVSKSNIFGCHDNSCLTSFIKYKAIHFELPSCYRLELRQYLFVLELPRFFTHCISADISKQTNFFCQWSRPYIVLALACFDTHVKIVHRQQPFGFEACLFLRSWTQARTIIYRLFYRASMKLSKFKLHGHTTL